MDRKPSFGTQLVSFFAGLTPAKRWLLGVLTLGTLATLLYVGTLSQRVEHALLYSELTTDDAAAIKQELEKLKVPHRLTSNGTAIEVPKDDVHSVRLQLASSGLPRGGGAGFELFDRQRFGATEFEQNVNLRRALEGELSRSIATIEGVQSARVHLVLPERRLFVTGSDKASASVVLKLRNSSSFGKREVAATVHLVSSAISGLSPQNVSVVSTTGTTLHRPNDDDPLGGGGSEGRSERERGVAKELEQHVQSLLERVVGRENVEVRASLTLSTARTERMAESHSPTNTALRSEQRTEEVSGNGQGPSVAGVPGAASNLGDSEVQTEAPLAGNMVRRSFTKNWEIDRVTEKTIIPAGQISRLSVSILVNDRVVGEPGKETFEARSEKELARLGEVAKGAVGFDESRGDTFSIQSAQFVKVESEPAAEAPSNTPAERLPIELLAVAGLGGLLLVTLLVTVLRIKKTPAPPSVQVLAAAEPAPELAPLAAPPQLAGAHTFETEELHSRAIDLARRDPATAAFVIQSWMAAEDTKNSGHA